MIEVIGVKFKPEGRVYYFDPTDKIFSSGDMVIVETARGIECGIVQNGNHKVEESAIVKPLKKVLREGVGEGPFPQKGSSPYNIKSNLDFSK